MRTPEEIQELRERATELRRAGKSLREINQLLGPIGNRALTDREIIIAGAIAYWCEGTKRKPYRKHERVIFMNSDPALIRFFLRFIQAVSVPPRRPGLSGVHPRER